MSLRVGTEIKFSLMDQLQNSVIMKQLMIMEISSFMLSGLRISTLMI